MNAVPVSIQKGEAQSILENLHSFRNPAIHLLQRKLKLEGGGYEDNPAWGMVLPDGYSFVSAREVMDDYLESPRRATGQVAMETPGAFSAWVSRYNQGAAVVFASLTEQEVTGVINYHRPKEDGGRFVPGFGDFWCRYECVTTEDWNVWCADTWRDQESFARLLEEYLDNIVHPSGYREPTLAWMETHGVKGPTPAELLHLAGNLDARVSMRVSRKVDLSSGQAELVYSEEHTDKGGQPLKVPGGFAIRLAVFEGSAPFELPVRLQYRIRNKQAEWRLAVHRADKAREQAFDEVVAAITAGCGDVPVFRGTP